VQTVGAPLYAAEKSEIERMSSEVAEARLTRSIAEDSAAEAKRRAARARADDDGKADELRQSAIDAAALAEAITVPVMPRLLADDATPEALGALMAAQGGRIALLSAEGGPFDGMSGRYSKFPNQDIYLKGHSGDPLHVDRQGRDPYFIERPALTIVVAFQPAILPTLAGREGFLARGLLARFLFSVPRSFVGTRKVGEPPLDPEVKERYDVGMKTLVLSLTEWRDPCVLTFSPEANELLLAFERELEPRLAPGGDLGALADWGSKLAGAVVRIAGLVHLAENLKTGYREPITAETFAAARAIGEYFLAHAIAAHGLMGSGTALGGARVLLGWLMKTCVPKFSKRDAHRAHQARFARATDLDSALELLETHGWIRRQPDLPGSPLGGRPPSAVYDVHPDVINGTLGSC
jgi:hypothetical protein